MKKLLILYLLFMGSQALAQQLSLDDCIAYALAHHPEIQNAKIEREKAHQNKLIAQKERLPTINGSFSQSGSLGRNIDPFSNNVVTRGIYYSSVGISASQLLYAGGKIALEIKKQEAAEELSSWDLKNVELNKKKEVLVAYIKALTSQSSISIQRLRMKEIENQVKQLDELILEGFKSPTDRLELELSRLDTDYNLTQLENEYRNDLISLKTAIFMNLESNISILNLEEDENTIPLNITFKQSPNYKKALEILRINSIEQSLIKARFKPTVNLNLNSGTSFSSAAPTEFTLGKQLNYNFGQYASLSVSVPIFNKNQKQHLHQLNQLDKIKIENEQRKLENDFYLEVNIILTDMQLDKARIENLIKQLSIFKDLLVSQNQKYFEGQINYNELNTWQNKYDEAALNLQIAKYQLLKKNKTLSYIFEVI